MNFKYHLTGEYDCKTDAKGRVRLPSSLIKQLGKGGSTQFVINRGFEKHLMLYPRNVWEKETKKINRRLNIYNNKERQALRYFYRGATRILTDASDRLLMPKSLIEYAGIEKEIVLFAYQEQIEIWAKIAYEKMIGEEPSEFSDLAEEVFGSGRHGSDNE